MIIEKYKIKYNSAPISIVILKYKIKYISAKSPSGKRPSAKSHSAKRPGTWPTPTIYFNDFSFRFRSSRRFRKNVLKNNENFVLTTHDAKLKRTHFIFCGPYFTVFM